MPRWQTKLFKLLMLIFDFVTLQMSPISFSSWLLTSNKWWVVEWILGDFTTVYKTQVHVIIPGKSTDTTHCQRTKTQNYCSIKCYSFFTRPQEYHKVTFVYLQWPRVLLNSIEVVSQKGHKTCTQERLLQDCAMSAVRSCPQIFQTVYYIDSDWFLDLKSCLSLDFYNTLTFLIY